MSTHSICFCREIRKISVHTLNLVKKCVLSEAVIHYMTLHIIFKDTISLVSVL